MARIERYTFVNNRARLQRLTDARIFAGWVKELTTTHLFLRPSVEAECAVGEPFFVEIHGGGRNATFRANFEVRLGDDLIFNIVSAIQFGSSSESVRQTVNGITGQAEVEGNLVLFSVVDVSEGGIGLLVPVPIPRGVLIDIELNTPQGLITCRGEVRYCRQDNSRKGFYRSGIAFQPLDRLEKARWQRVMERAAA
jgi:hypothetical protein